MKKKVFSKRKFYAWCKKKGESTSCYRGKKPIFTWPTECDGLDKEQVEELGYAWLNDWAVTKDY